MAGINTRRVAASVLAAALLVPALIGATKLAGWAAGSARDDTGTADREALARFADALQLSRDRTFTVRYTTGSGALVTYAQEPPRHAYRSAAGLYVAGPDATYMCRTPAGERANCSHAPGVETVPLGHARALSGVLDGDFLAPELVAAYLSRLAARSPGQVQRSERAIAGQPTRCIAIAGLFSACATEAGVLAEFEAPEGRLVMTGYQPTTTPDTFALPRNAAMKEITVPD
jgi:hypothetical protein